MNIKSLLLGSAAALLAVSGARAADAVTVAEPEPAEYVKICDVYGTGYFYIPGTEICMQIGASMRYNIGIGDLDGRQDVLDIKDDDGSTNDTYSKNAQVRFHVATGQETEYGTLKTYMEFRFNHGSGYYDGPSYMNGNGGVDTHFAYIQLGGFRVGLDESFFSTFVGYAGNIINDTLVNYGPFKTGVVQYYFDGGNGFSAGISLEEGYGEATIDSYVPHVVGGAKWTQGWGSIAGVLAYDSNDEGVTGKIRADVKLNDAFSLWIMAGYGSYDDGDIGGYQDFYKNWGGNWAVWGGGAYQFTEKASFNVQVSYDESKAFALAANVDYQPVAGFHIIPELNYVNQSDSPSDAFQRYSSGSQWGGILRFQRDF